MTEMNIDSGFIMVRVADSHKYSTVSRILLSLTLFRRGKKEVTLVSHSLSADVCPFSTF